MIKPLFLPGQILVRKGNDDSFPYITIHDIWYEPFSLEEGEYYYSNFTGLKDGYAGTTAADWSVVERFYTLYIPPYIQIWHDLNISNFIPS